MTFEEWWEREGRKWDPSGMAEGIALSAWEAATDAAKWQPIETAPRDGTEILIWDQWDSPGGTRMMFVAKWADYGPSAWYSTSCASGYTRAVNPTHWMPLPEPPEPPR